jgi:hypothetical protein
MTAPFQKVGAGWVDGERGRYLRSLWAPNPYEEIVAGDLMRIVAATDAHLRRYGIRFAIPTDSVFQALVDFLRTRLESPYREVQGPRRKVTRPKEWTEEDDRIWMEWLEQTVLTSVVWNRICDGPTRSKGVWEEAAGAWREEWLSYLPYYVGRSWDILERIDPRPIEETEWSGGKVSAAGEEEWRR